MIIQSLISENTNLGLQTIQQIPICLTAPQERYRAGQGSNEKHCTGHVLPAGASPPNSNLLNNLPQHLLWVLRLLVWISGGRQPAPFNILITILHYKHKAKPAVFFSALFGFPDARTGSPAAWDLPFPTGASLLFAFSPFLSLLFLSMPEKYNGQTEEYKKGVLQNDATRPIFMELSTSCGCRGGQ